MRRERKAMDVSPGGWGEVGSDTMTRYANVKADQRRGRRWCPFRSCPNRATHLGMANGVALIDGCEFHVSAWVHDPLGWFGTDEGTPA